MTTIERYAVKPAVIGTTGYLMSRTIFPQLIDAKWSQTFSFATNSSLGRLSGMQTMSVPMLAGVAVGLGSVVAELAHDFIYPHIHCSINPARRSLFSPPVVSREPVCTV